MNDKEKTLRDKYDIAAKKLGPSGNTGEKEFMVAYQNLVKAGYALQIKRKYRGSRG